MKTAVNCIIKRIMCGTLLSFILVSAMGCADSAPPVSDGSPDSSPSNQVPENSESEAESDSDVVDSESNGDTDSGNTENGDTEGGDTDGGDDAEAPNYLHKTYLLNNANKGIKLLGERRLDSELQLNLDWTGSGFEMNITHGGGDIVFLGNASAPCYFRVYLDGAEYLNGSSPYFEISSASRKIILKDIPAGDHSLKLVKVTGYTLSRAEILSVAFKGVIKDERPADKELYIEFVGDSISCGWGTIGEHKGAYTDQDGTLAYPLKIASALNADYSVTALSGQGLLVGNPGMTDGYLYGSALRNKNEYYSFERKADIAVINIGTNDYYYRTDNNITEETFKASYLSFLNTVKEKNGSDCKILCLYNTMNNTFENALLEAVAEAGGEQAGIYTYKTERAQNNAHPNIAEHEALTSNILEKLEQILAN